jgi:phage tail sheath protein FI
VAVRANQSRNEVRTMATNKLMNRSTPGVYISESNAFSQSVVGVNTAVPVFVGYTQTALMDGKNVYFQPIFLTSMADYIQVFGNEFNTIWEINPTPMSPPVAGLTPDLTVDGVAYSVTPAANQPQFNLFYSMKLFYANGGSTCYVVSVGPYTDSTGLNTAISADTLISGIGAAENQNGPTMLAVPDAVSLPTQADFNDVTGAMLTQAVGLQDRVAIFDIWGANTVPQMPKTDLEAQLVGETGVIAEFQQNAVFQNMQTNTLAGLSYGAAYFPFLNTSIVSPADINYTNFDVAQMAVTVPPATPPASTMTELQAILTLFNQEQYPDPATSPGATNATQMQVQTAINSIVQTPSAHDSTTTLQLNNLLSSALPQYATLLSIVASKAGVLPPSGAMAGLYTLNDQNRGVWNAPANLAVASTVSVSVNLNDDQQGDLNMPVNGMAIDVIRDFPGRGSVVWGARTMDGNSQDWRYIQIRRTIIYVEQSIKNAINPFVFAPNVASTWVAVKQMISGFLQSLWSQGGLMGDKPSDAFTVLCGVPDTMTATDILNGYMVVQVTLQMVHPAEFIELEFKQTMQG